jgi:hypothetical protein
MEYTTTDISAALSIAGVQVKSGSSKRVSRQGASCRLLVGPAGCQEPQEGADMPGRSW